MKKKVRRYNKKYYEANKEQSRKNGKRWAKNNPKKIADSYRKCMYGISSEEYNLKLKKQKNRCALCGKKETNRDYRSNKVVSLSVDHDHNTGTVRDLLCRNCNRVLGSFSDDVTLFEKAIQYLEKHNKE